jgi:hypothetical protein
VYGALENRISPLGDLKVEILCYKKFLEEFMMPIFLVRPDSTPNIYNFPAPSYT